MSELFDMLEAPRRAGLETYAHALGVTAPRFVSSGEYQAIAVRDRDGWCGGVKSATIEVTLQQTVYLAGELRPSSCAYRVVLAHERKHAKLNTRFLESLKGVLKRALERADLRGVRAQSAEAAQRRAMAEMDEIITKVVRSSGAELRRQQESVDTVEEYGRIYEICGESSMRRIVSGSDR